MNLRSEADPPQRPFHGKTKDERTSDRTGKASGGKSASESRKCTAKKSADLSRGTESTSTSQWAEAINELSSEFPLDLLLELRKMARSVFYYHLKRLKTNDKYALENETIKSIFHETRVVMAIVALPLRCVIVDLESIIRQCSV